MNQKASRAAYVNGTSYAVSIDNRLLKTMVFLGKFDEVARNVEADSLTSEHIKTYIPGLVQVTMSSFDAKGS